MAVNKRRDIMNMGLFIIGVMLMIIGCEAGGGIGPVSKDYFVSEINVYWECLVGISLLIFFIPYEFIYKLIVNHKKLKDEDFNHLLLLFNIGIEIFILLFLFSDRFQWMMDDIIYFGSRGYMLFFPVIAIMMASIICVYKVPNTLISYLICSLVSLISALMAYYCMDYLCRYSIMRFVLVLLFGFVFWNVCLFINNKKRFLLGLVLSIFTVMVMVFVFIIQTDRYGLIRYITNPERDPVLYGWELLQIRNLWSIPNYDSEIPYFFWREHHLLDLIWHHNSLIIFAFAGLILFIYSIIHFIKNHEGVKKYVVLGFFCYIVVHYIINILSSAGLFPCTTVSLPFTGFSTFNDTFMAVFIVRCMIPRHVFGSRLVVEF